MQLLAVPAVPRSVCSPGEAVLVIHHFLLKAIPPYRESTVFP